jgi:gamma-glutamylcyclotransferase (GGCT)/AIG2-like uncharacterized protein YtfP
VPLMFLNGEGMNGGTAHPHIAGSPFLGDAHTAPEYQFFAFGLEFPGLVRVQRGGASILGELYDVPIDKLQRLLASEPAELELSIVRLASGQLSFGMVVRADLELSPPSVEDITAVGSWRAYLGARG